ncbi:plastid ribosomal protein L10 [Haematococcus lacustris]
MLSSFSRPTFNVTGLRSPKAFVAATPSRGALQIVNAITREKKAATVETLKGKLESSVIVFGMRFKKLPVSTVQKFRKGLPEGASATICKNSLMKVAITQTEGWTMIAEKGCSGENAWVFVPEDAIQDTVKHFFQFHDSLLAEAKKTAPKGTEPKPPTELSVVVMENRLLSPADLRACEKIPTKKELLATIAMLAKQPATKLATGIKAVPNKLARAIKLVSELDEDKTKTLAQLVKA